MKKLFLQLLFCLMCLYQCDGLAGSQETLEIQIAPLLANVLPRAAVGIAVADAKTGQLIYEHNAFQAFNPASCAKLFSTAAALYALGTDYHFKTKILCHKGQLANGVLKGDLTIQFSGDPSMTVEKLDHLITEVRKAGVSSIEGNVVIDNTVFQAPWYGPGWGQDDLNWSFAAPISSVMLNQNAVPVNISANPTLNKPAALSFDNTSLKPFVQLSHDVKTVTYEEAMKDCQITIDADPDNHFHFGGCWPSSQRSQRVKVAIRNPDALAEAVVIELLKKQSISLSGKVVAHRASEKLNLLVADTSMPLKMLVNTVLKESNNVYAECITKALGQHLYHQGSFLAGSRAIKEILKKHTDIDFDQAVLVDGSGLSHYDLVTPRQIVRLLFVMGNEQKLSTIFMNALPESATDGTLRGRMHSSDLAHHVHAKTGTLKGISALSGYMTSKSGKPLVFSILINHVVGDADQSRLLQADIVAALYGGI